MFGILRDSERLLSVLTREVAPAGAGALGRAGGSMDAFEGVGTSDGVTPGGGSFRYERRTVVHRSASGQATREYDETRRVAAGAAAVGVVGETTRRYRDGASGREAMLVERTHDARGHAISRARGGAGRGSQETTAERLFGVQPGEADAFDAEWRRAAERAQLHRDVTGATRIIGAARRDSRAPAAPTSAQRRELAQGEALHRRRTEEMRARARAQRATSGGLTGPAPRARAQRAQRVASGGLAGPAQTRGLYSRGSAHSDADSRLAHALARQELRYG